MDRVGRTLALSVAPWLLFAAAARAALTQQPPAKAPAPLPQLLEGLELESTLTYDADPKTPHVLRVAFAGKEHARWWIGAGPEGSETRLMRLRSEDHVYALRLDGSASVELAGAQREEALTQLELRRALLGYESFEWKGAELSRESSLGALGSLRARFASRTDARPCEIAFIDPQGHVQDSCRALTWNSSGPRPVIAALELWHGEARVWKESVRRVQPMSYARDAFLPRDRLAGPAAAGSTKIVQTPAPDHAARRFPLPEKASWEDVLKALDQLRAEWTSRLAPLGIELENRGTLELDAELRPRNLVLRLSKIPDALPEGFERVAGRTAVGMPLEGFEQVGIEAYRALSQKLPAGAKADLPYLRWALGTGQVKQVVLLLSWTPAK